MKTSERVLALAMYREQLNDSVSESDGWPFGMESNLGELDWQAEKLIGIEWSKLDRHRQVELLRLIGNEIYSILDERGKNA